MRFKFFIDFNTYIDQNQSKYVLYDMFFIGNLIQFFDTPFEKVDCCDHCKACEFIHKNKNFQRKNCFYPTKKHCIRVSSGTPSYED